MWLVFHCVTVIWFTNSNSVDFSFEFILAVKNQDACVYKCKYLVKCSIFILTKMMQCILKSEVWFNLTLFIIHDLKKHIVILKYIRIVDK